MIAVEVAYALPGRQRVIALEVEDDCSVLAAAQRSGIAREFSQLGDAEVGASGEVDWNTVVLGIFGKVVAEPARTPLRAGDRIEIYRPLRIDPKAVRRERAQRQRESG